MRRRDVLGSIAAAAVITRAHAQLTEKARRIAVIMGASANDADAQSRLTVFRTSLEGFGWIDGKNIELYERWASGDPGKAAMIADEVSRLNPDVILAHNTIVVSSLMRMSFRCPIIFVSVFDPVGAGFIKSFAHPGGNITGFTNHSFSMASKWMEFAKEIKPSIREVVLLWCPKTAPYGEAFYQAAFQPSAPMLQLATTAARIQEASHIEQFISRLDASESAVAVMADPFLASHRKLVIEHVARRQIVTVYPWAYFVRDGGLISYGVDQADMFRRSASYVDRLLRGEQAGSLPVQGPVKFEIGVNLRTAKALRIEVPESLLLLADELIE
jgi:putative ABC transport system substrate-binding protein